MTTPLIVRYPLDPTGVSPDNKVQGELHTMIRRRVRAIATQYGAFFTESLRIVDAVTQQVLTPGTQYYAAELYELPTARYGKEICAIIIITDETVGDQVTLDYQALGGEYSNSMTAIIQQIENLALDDRPITWGAIVGKPEAFNPSHHYHDAGDIYGFEYVTQALDRVRAAILMGDDISHDAIYRYVDIVNTATMLEVSNTNANLANHIANHDNPHQVTAAQINAYTKQEVDALLADSQSGLAGIVNDHITNYDNPHQITKEQLGLGNVPNAPFATNPEALAGLLADKLMSPIRTAEVVAQHAGSAAHDSRYPRRDAAVELSFRINSNQLQAFINNQWRTVWPPQWQ